jgi:hypothetical protein
LSSFSFDGAVFLWGGFPITVFNEIQIKKINCTFEEEPSWDDSLYLCVNGSEAWCPRGRQMG